MHFVFTLIGFGLLLTTTFDSKWTGMSIALFVVAFNFIFAPFIQKFWFEVFFGFRGTDTVTTMVETFWERSIKTARVTPSFLSIRLSNLASVSYLVGATAFVGRVKITSVLSGLIFFNVIFYLSVYLNALISYSTTYKTGSFVYLDDYGTILVYLFGGAFGLIAAFLTKTPVTDIKEFRTRHSKSTFFFSAIGSLFIFGSFICSFTGIIEGRNNYRLNSGALMMAFGIVGGIIGNFVGSIFTGNGYFSPRIFSVGLISGGIMSGVLAGEYDNIGIATMLGFFGGLIAAIFNNKVRPKMNKTGFVDSQGLLGSIFVVAFFAAFVVTPCMLNQFYRRRDTMDIATKEGPEEDWRVARYHLLFFIVSLALGVLTGFFVGCANKFGNMNRRSDYRDLKFFAHGYGLYDTPAYSGR